MGKKSSRPLLRGRIRSEDLDEDSHRDQPEVNGNDEVDDFFEDRHRALLKDVGSDDSEVEEELEPELLGTEVLKVHSSESEDSENSDEEDGDMPRHPEEEKRGWGSRRKDWYGGDTNEFEIMEDDERDEALKDEEEEALRMQKKALEELKPEDFHDEDDGDTEPEREESDDEKKPGDHPVASEDVTADVMDVAAPEVPALVKEMIQSHKSAQALQGKARSNQMLRVMYHLHASLVTNVAYYLSLRTDPETLGVVDIRTHPVLLRIMSIRKLLQKSSEFSVPEELDNAEEQEDMTAADSAIKYPSHSEKDSRVEHVTEHGDSDKDRIEPATEEAHHGKMNGVVSKDKKKSRKRRRGRKRKRAELTVEEDEEKIQELLKTKQPEEQSDIEDAGKRSKKKKKLRNIVDVMESQRKNEEGKRAAPADEDLIRPAQKKTESSSANAGQSVDEPDTGMHYEDDDEMMQKMLAKKAKKAAREERKAAAAQPHVYRFNDLTAPDGKRKASSQIVKNKGLTRYRPRNKKTPRAKNRLAYANAVKRRKGAVREYVGKPGVGYSGEASGINMSARKGAKLSEV